MQIDYTKLPMQKNCNELNKEEIANFCKLLGYKRNEIPDEYWQRQWLLLWKFKERYRQELLNKFMSNMAAHNETMESRKASEKVSKI
jgi:hypothetical protein